MKAEALLDRIQRLQRDENEPNLKILVFTEFVPTQAMLAEYLGRRALSVLCLNGSMDLEQRQHVQRRVVCSPSGVTTHRPTRVPGSRPKQANDGLQAIVGVEGQGGRIGSEREANADYPTPASESQRDLACYARGSSPRAPVAAGALTGMAYHRPALRPIRRRCPAAGGGQLAALGSRCRGSG